MISTPVPLSRMASQPWRQHGDPAAMLMKAHLDHDRSKYPYPLHAVIGLGRRAAASLLRPNSYRQDKVVAYIVMCCP